MAFREPFGLTADLPEVLPFAGEFGAELNSFIPFVNWAAAAGLMRGRRIRTYRGMRPFYFFLEHGQVEEVDELRRYVPPPERPTWLPTRNDHASVRTPYELFPDYRAQFRDGLFVLPKPLLIIHNKVTLEWYRTPINVLPIPLLEYLFDTLAGRFHIVYIRPGLMGEPVGYSADQQRNLPFGDLDLLRRHPSVEIFDEMAAALSHKLSFNEVKLRLYAHADFHITVQGGNAHLLTTFPGGLISIFHRFGQEILHAYRHGHFNYAATPRQRWLLCRTPQQVAECVPLFLDAVLLDGEALLPAKHHARLQALSPAAQCGPDRMIPHDLQRAAG